jgi:hypothetical protein
MCRDIAIDTREEMAGALLSRRLRQQWRAALYGPFVGSSDVTMGRIEATAHALVCAVASFAWCAGPGPAQTAGRDRGAARRDEAKMGPSPAVAVDA